MNTLSKILPILCLSLCNVNCKNSQEVISPKPSNGALGIDYKNEPSMLHYVIVATLKDSLEQRKELIKSFNSQKDIKILKLNAFTFLDNKNKQIAILSIIDFENFKKAKKYAAKVEKSKLLSRSDLIYPISQDNYRRLLEKKDLDEFARFYSINFRE